MSDRRPTVVGWATHAVMVVAMVPCLVPGAPASLHAGAVGLLLAGAIVLALRARRDQRHLAGVIDLCAMAALALAALLEHHGDSGAAHHAAVGGSEAAVFAVVVLAGWAALRAASWRDAAPWQGARRAAVASGAMAIAMALAPVLG